MADDNEAERDDEAVPLQDLADAIAGRGEGSGNQYSGTHGETPDGGDDSEERSRSRFDAPLEELAMAVANRRASRASADRSGSPRGDQLADVARDPNGGGATGMSSRAARAVGRVMDPRMAGPREDASPFMYTVHYLVTGSALLGSAAVYIGSSFGLFAAQLWLLSLPLLTLGVIGALPVVSRWLGIWEPQELR